MNKFEFSTDFQYELLRFTVTDRDGYKALELYDDSYFTLLTHSVIAFSLKKYFKRKKRVPSEPLLMEEVLGVLKGKKHAELLLKDDKEEVIKLVKELYSKPAKDGDELLHKCEEFAQYVQLKDVIENIDLTDFAQYQNFSNKVQKAISPKLSGKSENGLFLVNDVRDRQFRRQDNPSVIPTPFWQINRLTNAGGYAKGSIIVVLDRFKKFKTGMLANAARGYIRMRKKVLVIDFENGEDEWMIRVEQGIANKTKRELLSGDHDQKVQKALRKYRRLGAELIVKRFPALTSTTNDIDRYMTHLYKEFGFKPQILVVDFLAKMGSISNKTDDTQRISDAYIDMENLLLKWEIEHCWTAMHVQRTAEVREATKYTGNDVAKNIDILRNAHAVYGLNRSPGEIQAKVMRMELVDQRDGAPSGRAVFKVDIERQRADELTLAERNKFDEQWVEPEESNSSKRKEYKPIPKPEGIRNEL